jgi:hypothetical protein
MYYTRKLVTLAIIVMVVSCIPQLQSRAESYQDDGNTITIIRAERENGVMNKEEVLEQISSSMEVNKPCGLTKEDFVDLLSNMKYDYNGVYARNAEVIWDLEQEYQVNGLFVCGLSAYESLWCSSEPATATNNYTSQMASSGKLIRYETEEDCFRATFENLANNYLDENGRYYSGKTISSINKRYCPVNSSWSGNVASCMKMFFN